MRGPFLGRLHRTSTTRAFALAVLVVFVFVGLLSTIVRAGVEQDSAVVGVKVGDWVKYKVTMLGPSTIWFPFWDDAVWIKLEVLDVSGTTVTISGTVHYNDGSESVENQSWNLPDDRPYNNRPLLTEFVIAATLGPGDKVGECPFFENLTSNKSVYADLILNDTDYRDYGGVTREVNQLKFTWLVLEYPLVRNDTLKQCWDKSTGFLLELTMQSYCVDYEWYPSIFMLEFADTNIWQVGKLPQQIVWLLATIPVGTVIAVAIAVEMRNRKNKNGADKQ